MLVSCRRLTSNIHHVLITINQSINQLVIFTWLQSISHDQIITINNDTLQVTFTCIDYKKYLLFVIGNFV